MYILHIYTYNTSPLMYLQIDECQDVRQAKKKASFEHFTITIEWATENVFVQVLEFFHYLFLSCTNPPQTVTSVPGDDLDSWVDAKVRHILTNQHFI